MSIETQLIINDKPKILVTAFHHLTFQVELLMNCENHSRVNVIQRYQSGTPGQQRIHTHPNLISSLIHTGPETETIPVTPRQ